MKRRWIAIAGLAGLGLGAGVASGQSGSLYGSPELRPVLTMNNNSWMYLEVDPPREIQLNDLVTVIVDEKSQMLSEGSVDRRKDASFDARLRDWLKLDGFGIKPAPQVDGDPRARASINNQYRAESEMETRDGLKFRIAARIVDVRPNGLLVLEGHRTVQVNHEVWDQSLSGEVRRDDVLPNNTVLSEDIAELRIYKREKGHVRDGYRRGWMLRMMDRWQPF